MILKSCYICICISYLLDTTKRQDFTNDPFYGHNNDKTPFITGIIKKNYNMKQITSLIVFDCFYF